MIFKLNIMETLIAIIDWPNFFQAECTLENIFAGEIFR